jgi:hypothetical protein
MGIDWKSILLAEDDSVIWNLSLFIGLSGPVERDIHISRIHAHTLLFILVNVSITSPWEHYGQFQASAYVVLLICEMIQLSRDECNYLRANIQQLVSDKLFQSNQRPYIMSPLMYALFYEQLPDWRETF